jgi:diguanylate cyclase (GGDEF)-like protein
MEQPVRQNPSPEHGYREVRRSYLTATRWSRFAMGAFWILFAAFLLWAVPVFPWGMSSADYSPQVLAGLILLGACPGVTAIALLSRSIAAQRREALVAWGSIHDRTTGLRNREFFLERLKLQCELGRDLKEYQASLMLVTVEEKPRDGRKAQPVTDEVFRRIAAHVARQLRPSDLLAAISTTELAILVAAGSEVTLAAVASRIEHSLEMRIRGLIGEAARQLVVRIGCASFESDAPEPEAMLESARSSLTAIYSGEEDSAVA